MAARSSHLAVGFSFIGHSLMHIHAGLYLTIVLALEDAWAMGYDELIRLWTFGALLIGLGAPLAGWLADRWSDRGMMAVFFLLTGGGSILAGLADGPLVLWIGLAALGLGASIYHPVGMSWLVKNVVHQGRALGYQGIFGSVGVAVAALVAGSLIDAWNWRAAFLIPGAVTVFFGLLLVGAIAGGWVEDRTEDRKPQPAANRRDVMRAFVVLSVTMLSAGMVWNALQVVMPKWFEAELGDLVGDSVLGIGGLVTAVYLVAAVPQVLGGYLADRVTVKTIYLACLGLQLPLLVVATSLGGVALLACAVAILIFLSLQIPAENVLLTRFTPSGRRGLAFGAKFILTFGVGPLAVEMVALFYRWTGAFDLLFMTLAACVVVAVVAALHLPGERRYAGTTPTVATAAAGGGD